MIKYLIKILTITMLLSLSANVSANEDDYDKKDILAKQYISKAGNDPSNRKAFDECVAKLSEIDWRHGYRICAFPEIDRLKNIVNKTYAKLMKSKISMEDKKNIEIMQRTWLSYKKHLCGLNEHFLSRSGVLAEHRLYEKDIDYLRYQANILNSIYDEIQEYIEGSAE